MSLFKGRNIMSFGTIIAAGGSFIAAGGIGMKLYQIPVVRKFINRNGGECIGYFKKKLGLINEHDEMIANQQELVDTAEENRQAALDSFIAAQEKLEELNNKINILQPEGNAAIRKALSLSGTLIGGSNQEDALSDAIEARDNQNILVAQAEKNFKTADTGWQEASAILTSLQTGVALEAATSHEPIDRGGEVEVVTLLAGNAKILQEHLTTTQASLIKIGKWKERALKRLEELNKKLLEFQGYLKVATPKQIEEVQKIIAYQINLIAKKSPKIVELQAKAEIAAEKGASIINAIKALQADADVTQEQMRVLTDSMVAFNKASDRAEDASEALSHIVIYEAMQNLAYMTRFKGFLLKAVLVEMKHELEVSHDEKIASIIQAIEEKLRIKLEIKAAIRKLSESIKKALNGEVEESKEDEEFTAEQIIHQLKKEQNLLGEASKKLTKEITKEIAERTRMRS